MTRDESTIMKGVAILLMLFFHLFNRMDFVGMCQTTIHIGGLPLVHILTRAANPVSFFIMLSGYGLYVSHKKSSYNVWRKIRLLYVHYWLTLLVFVPIGYFVIGSYRYPGNWLDIIGNAIGWNVSYNGEIWFLLPFIILMLCSGWIIKYLDKLPSWFCISVSFCISFVCGWLIPRNNVLLFHILLLAGTFALAFTLGVYMSKYQIVRKFNTVGGVKSV